MKNAYYSASIHDDSDDVVIFAETLEAAYAVARKQLLLSGSDDAPYSGDLYVKRYPKADTLPWVQNEDGTCDWDKNLARYRILGFSYSSEDAKCEACGLYDMDGAFPVCDGCDRCSECVCNCKQKGGES